MSFEEINENIRKIADDSIDILALENLLYKELFSNFENSVLTRSGIITELEKPAGRIITESIKSFTNSNQYRDSLAVLLRNIKAESKNKVNLYQEEGFKINTVELNKPQMIAVDAYIDNLEATGLNAELNQPIRRLIYDNIRKGTSQKQIEKAIKESLKKGEIDSKFSKYVRSSAINVADAYNSIVDQNITDKYKDEIKGYRIVGSLIDNSSRQCRMAVRTMKGFISMKEIDSWIKYAKENGGDKNLNRWNLPSLKSHYGCRHEFIPSLKDLTE